MVYNVNDYKGLAHGVNDSVINYDMRQIKDADGDAYIGRLVDLAKSKGEGWVKYKYNHPITFEVKVKTAYVERVDDIAISCGAYESE